MPQYILLAHVGQEAQSQRTPEELQQMTREYIAWVGSLMQQGKYSGGQKLKESVRLMRRGDNGQVVMDGPYTEVKELVGGFFQIEAANMEEAIELAKGCPIFKTDGALELREVDPVEK
ncbi:MAG TPA: YciI family protein [Capsulimonadaceae bacterium]|nr:YciI family protein [Capsulimonadaceae bacterium]